MKPLIAQILTMLAAASATWGWGMAIGLSAVIIPKLREKDDGLGMDDTHISWFGSLLPLGSIPGSILPGLILKNCGCKYPLLFFNIVFIAGFGLIGGATTDYKFLAHLGRGLTGFAVGGAAPIAFVYIGEIASPQWRGKLGATLQCLLPLAITYIMTFGEMVSWKIACVMCIVPMVLGTILLTVCHDSPYGLVFLGREADARKSLMFLNGNDSEKVDTLMQEIKDYLATASEQPTNKSLIAKDVKKLRKNIKKSKSKRSKGESSAMSEGATEGQDTEDEEEEGEGYASLKAFVLLLCLYGFARLSGNSPISFYVIDVILDKLNAPDGLPINPNLLSPLIGASELFGSIMSIFLIDRSGRVLLLIISGIGMSLALGMTAAASHIIENGDNVCASQPFVCQLPTIGVVLCYIFYAVGFGCVPSVVSGEILPNSSKGLIVSVINIFAWIVNFILAKLFYEMAAIMGYFGVFLFYALCSLTGALFTWLFLPETKNKTLAEIQDKLNNRRARRPKMPGRHRKKHHVTDANTVT